MSRRITYLKLPIQVESSDSGENIFKVATEYETTKADPVMNKTMVAEQANKKADDQQTSEKSTNATSEQKVDINGQDKKQETKSESIVGENKKELAENSNNNNNKQDSTIDYMEAIQENEDKGFVEVPFMNYEVNDRRYNFMNYGSPYLTTATVSGSAGNSRYYTMTADMNRHARPVDPLERPPSVQFKQIYPEARNMVDQAPSTGYAQKSPQYSRRQYNNWQLNPSSAQVQVQKEPVRFSSPAVMAHPSSSRGVKIAPAANTISSNNIPKSIQQTSPQQTMQRGQVLAFQQPQIQHHMPQQYGMEQDIAVMNYQPQEMYASPVGTPLYNTPISYPAGMQQAEYGDQYIDMGQPYGGAPGSTPYFPPPQVYIPPPIVKYIDPNAPDSQGGEAVIVKSQMMSQDGSLEAGKDQEQLHLPSSNDGKKLMISDDAKDLISEFNEISKELKALAKLSM